MKDRDIIGLIMLITICILIVCGMIEDLQINVKTRSFNEQVETNQEAGQAAAQEDAGAGHPDSSGDGVRGVQDSFQQEAGQDGSEDMAPGGGAGYR